MPATYEPIATTTLGSAASSITLSSIPSTYTDLRLVVTAISVSSNAASLYVQFNSDSGNNYSNTQLEGTGSSAQSGRTTNILGIFSASTSANNANAVYLTEIDIFSYAGSTNKTVLISNIGDQNGQGLVGKIVGLWRNTSAINTIKLTGSGGNFGVGTTATLYGIKAA